MTDRSAILAIRSESQRCLSLSSIGDFQDKRSFMRWSGRDAHLMPSRLIFEHGSCQRVAAVEKLEGYSSHLRSS